MSSGFGPEGQSSIPDATKISPSACGVRALKIRSSERPVVGRQQFTKGVVSGENFPPLSKTYQNWELELDGADTYRKEADIGFLSF